jgi:hypothetical protein
MRRKTAKPGGDPKQLFLMKDQDNGFCGAAILFLQKYCFYGVIKMVMFPPDLLMEEHHRRDTLRANRGTLAAMAIAAFIEHDQVIANYFGGKFFIAVFVFPAACA